MNKMGGTKVTKKPCLIIWTISINAIYVLLFQMFYGAKVKETTFSSNGLIRIVINIGLFILTITTQIQIIKQKTNLHLVKKYWLSITDWEKYNGFIMERINYNAK